MFIRVASTEMRKPSPAVGEPKNSATMAPISASVALTLSAPKIPVINNVDVSIESDPERIKDALVRQAYNPVRWVETVQKMAAMGVSTVAECGPGKVLAGLTKRCADGVAGIALADVATIEANLGLE